VAVVYPGTTLGTLFGDAEDQIFYIPEEAWALSQVPISIIESDLFFFGYFSLCYTPVHRPQALWHIICTPRLSGIFHNHGLI